MTLYPSVSNGEECSLYFCFQFAQVVYAENDPNRPRFTLPELKDILQERNSLKAKVSDLEDELAVFRPRKAR